MRAALHVAALVVLLALTIAAQEPFRSGVNFVRVDVLVTTADGAPVTDLTIDDFEVVEDGARQAIEQFRLVQVTGNEDPRRPLPLQVRSIDQEQELVNRDDVRVFAFFLDDYHIREENWRGIRDELIAFVRSELGTADLVAIMTPSTPVTALGFTRDHESIVSQLRAFEGRQGRYFPPKNVFEEQYAFQPAPIIDRIRNDVSTSALQGLAVRLGSVRERRKSIVLVSQGLRNMLLLRDIYREANRHNVAIYSLDPLRLLGNRPGSQRHESLRLLADETGGRLLLNNNVRGFLTNVIRDSSAYYLFGYSSTSSQNDGKFHEVKVRVKRRGVTVHARKGYWAMSAADAEKVAAGPAAVVVTPAQKALAALAAVDANRFVYRWVGTARGPDGLMRVTIAWEPKADRSRQAWEQPGQVGVIVATADGQVVFRGGGSARGPGIQIFEATPGRRDLRLTIDAAANGETIDRDHFTIDVPDLAVPGSLSTPRVFRARTVSEFRALTTGSAPPTARREFLRSDRLLIRFDTDAAGVSAALVNASGRTLAEVGVAPATAGGTHQIDLALGAFSQGQYVLQITAGERTEFVPFRITS